MPLNSPRRRWTREKIPFRENQQLQVFDFIEAKFAIMIVFEFFLMTAEDAAGKCTNFEIGILRFEFFDLADCAPFCAEELPAMRLPPLDALSKPYVSGGESKDEAACAASVIVYKEVAEITSDANLCAMDPH
jgi:hypothetical protein